MDNTNNIFSSAREEQCEQKPSNIQKLSVSEQINELRSSKPKETRVLLVTLVNNVNNTVLQHNKYYQAFSKYGEVQRILIFQKISPWATFIEMDTVENARLVRQELNNTQILPDGTKFVILPSTKERIELQEKNNSGVDYTKLKQKILEKQLNVETEAILEQMLKFDDLQEDEKKSHSPLKQSLYSSENNDATYSNNSIQSSNTTAHSGITSIVKGLKSNLNQTLKTTFTSEKNSLQASFSQEDIADNQNQEFQDSNNSNYSHLPNESSVHNELEDLNLAQSVYSGPNNDQQNHSQLYTCDNLKYFQNNLASSNTCKMMGGQNNNKSIQNLFNSAPNELNFYKPANSPQTADIYQQVDENTNLSQYVHPQFAQITKKSKVIYANRFDPSKTAIQQIFNLFSAFGNIVKMIFMKGKQAVLIEYSSIDHACFAKDYLGDKTFNGNIIKIFYSRYENIFFKEPEERPADEEYFEPNEKINRFKSDAQAVINSPIDTLHISNIRRDDCNFDVIKNIIQPFGQIKKIKFMLEKNNKNMCLVKFDSPSIAMWVLANVHNRIISERPLKISFSKRTLE